jgi:hypothetical protein
MISAHETALPLGEVRNAFRDHPYVAVSIAFGIGRHAPRFVKDIAHPRLDDAVGTRARQAPGRRKYPHRGVDFLLRLVPDGESVAGTEVPNDRFFAVGRRPRDGVVRSGELDIGAVAKRDEYCLVGADHIEPAAASH